MASNPDWCQPESVWRDYFGSWMETPLPAQLLRASIFFDLRPVGGDESPGRDLCQWVSDRAPSHTLFQRHMARVALERHVPLGFFGGFVVERSGMHKDQLDLKARGIFPMTQAMRVCALSLGVAETNTVDRLVAAGARGLFTPGEVEDLRDGYEVIARVRLNHQLACLDAGRAVDNFIDPDDAAQVRPGSAQARLQGPGLATALDRGPLPDGDGRVRTRRLERKLLWGVVGHLRHSDGAHRGHPDRPLPPRGVPGCVGLVARGADRPRGHDGVPELDRLCRRPARDSHREDDPAWYRADDNGESRPPDRGPHR